MGKHYATGRVFEVEEEDIPVYCKAPGCKAELTEDEKKEGGDLCSACRMMEEQERIDTKKTVDEINFYTGGGRIDG